MSHRIAIAIASCFLWACTNSQIDQVEVYETSKSGHSLTPISISKIAKGDTIIILPEQEFQTITGFGGAFTQSTAYILKHTTAANRKKIINAYFSESGANYSLTRTHINSCDFSVEHYSYDSVPNDTHLVHFSITPDEKELIPLIKEAQKVSAEGFKIIASPWTAPPWMKTNNHWNGGKLKPEFYTTWANYFVKYLEAYQKQNIPIWALTIENEPLGNNSNWESMHYTPTEMSNFVKHHLAPTLTNANLHPKLLVYDQNKGPELTQWTNQLLTDTLLLPLIYGTAVHWYDGTEKWFPNSLQHTHQLAPNKHIIHTEACIDNEIPVWNKNEWYWQKNATDWGYTWAAPDKKINHPKYVPVYRYAQDIIGCLNNWVEGWIDWNMVLNEKGGPNLAQNWCIAPIMVHESTQEVYITPLYYILSHFSKFIRPNAIRIGFNNPNPNLQVTATKLNGVITLIILNNTTQPQPFVIKLQKEFIPVQINAEAIQTIVIKIPHNS